MKAINFISLLLVIIGALNWGLVGAFHFNLVAAIFGKMPGLMKTVYILVGLSGLWNLKWLGCCSSSDKGKCCD